MGIVFFFQAEDGIRDVAVTGVQTCALPIFQAGAGEGGRGARADAGEGAQGRAQVERARVGGRGSWRRGDAGGSGAAAGGGRSEERRVGKECRSRWSRRHSKKR